jgi:uncharacterized membrane protein YhaH (DUF805 family)
MTFIQAIQSGFANYVNFSGRDVASEFRWWQLFVLLVAFAAGMVDGAFNLNTDVIADLWALVTSLPGLAVSVRRLHDSDRSGWWLFVLMILFAGLVLLIAWFFQDGTPGTNRFGADPRHRDVSPPEQGRSLHRGQTSTTS